MGLGGLFRKIGKVGAAALSSPVGDILVVKYVPKELQPLVEKAREAVESLEVKHASKNYERSVMRLDSERIYRDLAIEAQKMGVQHKPSELYSLIEDALQEQKGNAFIGEQ